MYQATWKHKKLVRKILLSSFSNDPHTDWLITNCINERKLKNHKIFFMDFNFTHAMTQGRVFISDDNTGCALWVDYGNSKISLRMAFLYLRFLLIFGIKHTNKVQALQKYIDDQYIHNKFLHLVYLGVLPDYQGKGIGSSLLNPVLQDAKNEGLPVLLETSKQVNVSIYEKKGFKLFHKYKVPDSEDLQIYFMEA